jgi:thioredoxin-related protein
MKEASMHHYRVSSSIQLVVVIGVGLLAFSTAAQTPADNKSSAASFTEAKAQAKKAGRPLVVFGMSPGCGRCAALKEAMDTQPEVKELLAKYIATELPFGGREFAEVYRGIIAKDAKYNQPIGAPSLFIFTSSGETIYAGPNNPNGMQSGEEFKNLLTTGIEKNAQPGKAAKPAGATAKRPK